MRACSTSKVAKHDRHDSPSGSMNVLWVQWCRKRKRENEDTTGMATLVFCCGDGGRCRGAHEGCEVIAVLFPASASRKWLWNLQCG